MTENAHFTHVSEDNTSSETSLQLLRLSEILKRSKQPATFYRHFLQTARTEQFGVILLADMFKIPSNRKGGKVREVHDYAIIPSDEFTTWNRAELALESGKVVGIAAPTFEQLLSGAVDVGKAQQQTVELLKKQAERNQKNSERLRNKRAQDTE